jgi:hypothetical protein
MATNTCSKPATKSFTVADILNSQQTESDNLLVNIPSKEYRTPNLHALMDLVCSNNSVEISALSDRPVEEQKDELSSFMTCCYRSACRHWTWTQGHSLPSICELV